MPDNLCFLRMNLKPIVFDDSSRNEYNNALEDEDHIQFAAFIDKIWKAKNKDLALLSALNIEMTARAVIEFASFLHYALLNEFIT
ncbi:hypothetical protein niasHT_006110 [Heterodera trifolii]|uniref:Uncharacterized protein n=1 Tax=Heterodera trifolii TaxID=157864 RepID=A0ABD2M6C4_9BILA